MNAANAEPLRYQVMGALARFQSSATSGPHSRLEHRRCALALDELRELARKRFADAHGLVRARKHFSLRQLRDGSWVSRSPFTIGGREDWDAHELINRSTMLDHPEYFRDPARPYRPAAIVAHLYSRDAHEPARVAAHYGLRLEVLDWSWYSPDACIAVAYLRGAG